MDLELRGKVAVISGGSRGIGKAIALELAKEGANVAILARDQGALDATAKEIAALGVKAQGFKADTSDEATVKKAVADVVAAFGRIDILVNCAAQPAGQKAAPKLTEITNDDFWADMNVKVMGYVRTAAAVAPYMKTQKSGRIINISGLAARGTGNIIGTIRNVSVAALTKNLADELAPHGISAICVHPGLTRTEKTPGVVANRAKNEGISEQDVEKKMASGNLIKKLLTSQEIAYVVTFLASQKALAINGDTIAAGGGVPGVVYY